MKRRIYIYQKNISEEIVDIFNNLSENIYVESIEENVVTVVDRDYYSPEPIDLTAFQELIQEDFGGEVSIFIEPYLNEDFYLGALIKAFLCELPHNVFFFEDIITYVVLKNNQFLRNKIIDYITSQTNNEVIHTVREFIENNMNSSLSAKKLFMHRNTLNYRIDNFIEATHINVKTFKGANAIYMLFKF